MSRFKDWLQIIQRDRQERAERTGEKERAFPMPTKISNKMVALAEINHGRFIANCPFCSGAEKVYPDDPIFFCAHCLMQKVEGQYIKVIFPDAKRMAQIEEILSKRMPQNQNWHPGESLAQLKRENKLMGVG